MFKGHPESEPEIQGAVPKITEQSLWLGLLECVIIRFDDLSQNLQNRVEISAVGHPNQDLNTLEVAGERPVDQII